jgi:hypothetical protein
MYQQTELKKKQQQQIRLTFELRLLYSCLSSEYCLRTVLMQGKRK